MKPVTPKRAKKVFKLIEQWTRAEVWSRFGNFGTRDPRYTNATNTKLDLEDQIREEVLGTGNQVVLGKKWGIIAEAEKETHRKKVKKRKKQHDDRC